MEKIKVEKQFFVDIQLIMLKHELSNFVQTFKLALEIF